MNKTFLFGILAGSILLASCGTGETPATEGTATDSTATAAAPATHHILADQSAVNWTGTMLGVKSHTGTLNFTDGHVTTAGGQLTGGKFTVDMRSYQMTDTNYAADGSAQGTRAMLMGHLMSPDFFAVDSFPTASFEITKVEGNTATGNLTVRGRTFPETVKDIVLTQDANGVSATGNLTFDRQKYGVSWSSPMKDMVLSNDIVLKVDLKAAPTATAQAQTAQPAVNYRLDRSRR